MVSLNTLNEWREKLEPRCALFAFDYCECSSVYNWWLSFPPSFSFSTKILLLRDQYMQVSKWSALQRNSSFQKLFSLHAEEFLINDFEVCMCY
jgi:hypothetical protein